MNKKVNSRIETLFPVPVYFSSLERKMSKEELNFVEKCKSDVYKNEGNITSNNTYVLEEKYFKNLKKEIILKIKDYFKNTLCINDSTEPFITQSWLNYTEKNQFHHKHYHPNSFISGVFYINSNKEFDKIKFFKEDYKTIKPEVTNWNLYNSESWWFPVETGDIVLFPSSLSHCVEVKEGDNTRISLAFNTFVKGSVGNSKTLTELLFKYNKP